VTTHPTPWQACDVLLCADDFAYNSACSQAIAQLAEAGKIQATSAMVLSPRWAQDVALLRPLRGRISVGLHLDWTSDFALAAGHGMSLGSAMLRAVAGGFSAQKARAVIAQQLDQFEAHWGSAPDHVDGHQHVQQFAGIRQALVQEVVRRYPQSPPWLRISDPVHDQKILKAMVLRALGAAPLKALAKQAGLPCRPFLAGIYNFRGGQTYYGELLSHWQRDAPQGTVIMCHPATRAEAGDSIGPARVWEYAALAT
jgi:chitin disaccharide deacetylase